MTDDLTARAERLIQEWVNGQPMLPTRLVLQVDWLDRLEVLIIAELTQQARQIATLTQERDEARRQSRPDYWRQEPPNQ